MTTWECFLLLFSPPAFGSEIVISLIVDWLVVVLSMLTVDNGIGVWRWVAWGGVEECIERRRGVRCVIEVLNVFGILGLRIAVENALVADKEIDSLNV
jgi:hypothetical protein